jgi:hypothetical protein
MNKKEDELTIELIETALSLINEDRTCKKCNTIINLSVLGFIGEFCKCEANKLCELPEVKAYAKELKEILSWQNQS